MGNISYELDACAVCQDYEPNPTHSMKACSVGHLRHDIRELKRVLREALRTYTQLQCLLSVFRPSQNALSLVLAQTLMINIGIEEEETNGMFTNYKYQRAFHENPVSWMQKYDTIHSMLHEISLNMTVMKLLVNQRLMTSFLHSLRSVMCQLQATFKLGSFAQEDMHLQVTCRRSLIISREIENPSSTNLKINFSIRSLLIARDALNEIYDVLSPFRDLYRSSSSLDRLFDM